MAIKHGEITRTLPDGSILAWDSTEVNVVTRRAMDKIVEQRVNSLRELLGHSVKSDAPKRAPRKSAAA